MKHLRHDYDPLTFPLTILTRDNDCKFVRAVGVIGSLLLMPVWWPILAVGAFVVFIVAGLILLVGKFWDDV